MVNRKRTLRRKPVVDDIELDKSFLDEFDAETLDMVDTRWQPEKACRPNLKDAPAYYPTEEEFEDPLNYIAKIRPTAELFGICRIIPPFSWKPPCPLKKREMLDTFKFETRVQRIDKLQNRSSRKSTSDTQNYLRGKKRKRILKDEDQSFFFEEGPDLTLKSFQNYANDFKKNYFRNNCSGFENEYELSVEDIEGEYWRVVEYPTEKVEVLYGADLDNRKYGSGFPQISNQDCSPSAEKYIESGWNLNNLPRLPGSLLSYESSDVSGVLVPWVYLGMCFSSFCWHVEDHHLYSVNYLHWGAPKIWYGVPQKDANKFEATMRKFLPELFAEEPDLLHKLVTQLSPTIMQSEGVPVFRCVQNPGEFVLTFPQAYHSGFNSGFNCAEAVNVATVDWLAHGQNAVQRYQVQKRKTTISNDRLLLGAANEAVKAWWEIDLLKKFTSDNLRWKYFTEKDGVLTQALKERVEMERGRRESLSKSSQQLKMEKDFDATTEKECIVCLYDLHMSAAYCRCSPDRFACLEHAEKLCSCGRNAKIFLFRYSISDLNTLVEALEGKLRAIIKWGKQELGCSVSSYLKDRNSGILGHAPTFSQSVDEKLPKKISGQLPKASSTNSEHIFEHVELPCGSFSLPENTSKPPPISKELFSTNKLHCVRDKDHACNIRAQEHHIYHEITSSCKTASTSGSTEAKPPSIAETETIVLISDDKDEEPVRNEVSGYHVIHTNIPDNKDQSAAGLDEDHCKMVICSSSDKSSSREKDCKQTPEEYATESPLLSFTLSSHDAVLDEYSSESPTKIEDDNVNVARVKIDLNVPACTIQSSCAVSDEYSQDDFTLEQNENFRAINNNVKLRPQPRQWTAMLNLEVIPLQFGTVLSGEKWCNDRTMFPKGYKSQATYISILNPSRMCTYFSEIVDGGHLGPLFVVTLESCPDEVFIHLTPNKCWDLVRERVNHQITKHNELGMKNLPPLQSREAVDGMLMFGLSSPKIIQEIEAMDQNHVCAKYWNVRGFL
ncbi:hypothetical protein QQ045_015301 [Rhodiola kirilowii]